MALPKKTLLLGVVAVLVPVIAACSGCFKSEEEKRKEAEQAAWEAKRVDDPMEGVRTKPREPADPEKLSKVRAERKERMGEARGVVLESTNLPPEARSPSAEVVAAKALIESGDAAKIAEGRAALDTIIAASATDADAFYWRGRAYVAADDRENARLDYQQARVLDADWRDPVIQLADVTLFLEGCQETLPILEDVIALTPDKPHGYADRGKCKYKVRDLDAALPDLRRACDDGIESACPLAKRMERRRDRRIEREQQQAERNQGGDTAE